MQHLLSDGSTLPQQQTYFIDQINQTLYYLRNGTLHSQTGQQQHQIVTFPLSSAPSQNSRHQGLVTISGQIVTNTDCNVISTSSDEAILRGLGHISDGMRWQWHAPLSLQGLHLGICKLGEGEQIKYQFFQFNSSTSRTVSFQVEGQNLFVWVNGSKPNKLHSKIISYDNLKNKWYPCVKLHDKGNTIIFLPFSTLQPNNGSSIYNPFGKLTTSQPNQEELTETVVQPTVPLTNIIQLSKDKVLLRWENNTVRIIQRNADSLQFDFGGIAVHANQVSSLFSGKDYQVLKEWRGEKALFECKSVYSLTNIFQWIRYLISELDRELSPNHQVYKLLLTKLIDLRPYLLSLNITIPNLIATSQYDIKRYLRAFKYFNIPSYSFNIPAAATTSHLQWKIQGEILDVTQNYLATKYDKHIIVYNLQETVQEIYRESLDKKISFQKNGLIQNIEEGDIRSLKSEGSFLYKILIGCLQKERKTEEIHLVNENDVKELTRDYGIPEQEARLALEQTGHVEEALVWIYSEKKMNKLKHGESLKEEQAKDVAISMVELDNMFAKLLLQIGNRIYILGVLPKQIKKWLHKSQKQYVDLVTFKHEENIGDLNWKHWFDQGRHPRLTILDMLETKTSPTLLFKQEDNIHYLTSTPEGCQQRCVKFNSDQLFECQTSLSESQEGWALPFKNCDEAVKVISGELVSKQSIKQSLNQQIQTIASENNQQQKLIRFNLQSKSSILPATEEKTEFIPFIVQSGPPGCNTNYSISSILQPKASFLANYPHQIVVRHLHNKLFKASSVFLQRSTHRKNVNTIIEGVVYFSDEENRRSKNYNFVFCESAGQVQIKLLQSQYWKYLNIIPKFTHIKKLPFQIGFLSAKGHSLSSDVVQLLYYKTVAGMMNLKEQANRHISIINVTPISDNIVQIQAHSHHIQSVNQLLNSQQQYVISHRVPINRAKNLNELLPQTLSAQQIITYLFPTSQKLEYLLRKISRSQTFSLSGFTQIQVFKFVDLVLYYTGNIKSQDYFTSIFDKIWENPSGRKYLQQVGSNLTETPAVPLPYLRILITKLDDNSAKSIIGKLVKAVPSYCSKRYQTQKDSKYPHLLFQNQFYSNYYFSLLEPASQDNTPMIFQQSLIETEVAVFKGDLTRRLIVKLPSVHFVSNFTLRMQRSEVTSKLNYNVFTVGADGKTLVGEGRILEHQWCQITKHSHQQEVESIFGNNSKLLNVFGLDVKALTAQYFQIQLSFSSTGIVNHVIQSSRIPQIDILPQFYGYPTGSNQPITSIQSLFNFNPEQLFFLSVSSLTSVPLLKYSASRGGQVQYLYFKTQHEEQTLIKSCMNQKIEKNDYQAVVNLQRRLFKNIKKYSAKICLDYLYTLFILTFNQLQSRSISLDYSVSQSLLNCIVSVSQGPIKMLAFKALSHHVPLLIKSLQFVQSDLPTLGKLSFSYQQLLQVVDFNSTQLCNSLTRLILRGVSYQQKWAQLLIKMSQRTQAHQQIFKYIIPHDDWLTNSLILQYIAGLSEDVFINTLVPLISYAHLCRYVLVPSAKSRIQQLLEVIVDQSSETQPVDLDVVGLIFQQEQIRWEQLQKVISCCPEAIDTVIHQFLQSDTPEILACQHHSLLITSALPKYAEEFAVFLTKIFTKDRTALRDVFLSLAGKCTTIHYDFLQTVAQFMSLSCNFGGIQGIRVIGEQGLANIQTAVEMLKAAEKIPQGAQLPNQEIFIQWYLNNNDYELAGANPAHKSPGYHLMRTLVELTLHLLKTSSPSKILNKYTTALHKIKTSRRMSLTRRHLAFNQLHFGATQLLAHTLTFGSLAEVLVGETNPLLGTVINQLKGSILRGSAKKPKWGGIKQVDITQKFALIDSQQQIKDLQSGKGGSKQSILKLPITQKQIKLQSEEHQWPSKFIIGFTVNDNAEHKTGILPTRVELFGGNSKAMIKIGDLNLIQDQFFLSYGVRLFGLNLNSISSIGSNSIKNIQVRLHEPILASASQVLQHGQKSKKGATYNVSFINVTGFDSQPTDEPDYTQLYVTLLGFLGQPKYRNDLKRVVASQQFDQKLQLIIQVLNDLLPNLQIEQLLLALNKEGENVLQHILRSKGANPRLINLLILGKPTKDNISKLISYALDNLTPQYVNIVTVSLRLASYAEPSREANKTIASLSNVQVLLQKYENADGQKKGLYFQLISALLTVPNLYHYQIGKLVASIWAKLNRQQFYSLLSAVLPYYSQELQNFAINKTALKVFQQVLAIMQTNNSADSVLKDPQHELLLLSTLVSNSSSKEQLLTERAPIRIVSFLRSNKSLLLKYSTQTMKLFISFFQSTCIGTVCQDQFSQILIALMTSLNNFQAVHHQFFIQNFFFPLINAFKGIPLFFVWKDDKSYIWQPTQVLKSKPIKSSSKVLTYDGQSYSPIDSIDESYISSNLIISFKQNGLIQFAILDKVGKDVQTNQIIAHNFKQGKLTLQVGADTILTLPHQKYTIYQQSNWQQNLLTNSTLINLHNPWILQDKYKSIHPIKDSTTERCYSLPQEMTIGELLKHINISGLRIHVQDQQTIKIKNYLTQIDLTHQMTLRDILNGQKLPYLKIELQASQLFKNTTVEGLANEEPRPAAFVAQQTIFKAFEEKKGLQKLIGVLTGCVKNWANLQQSKIWGQYLKQLQSYSCFPVFSSLYMTKQSNVGLLFDLLLGLPDKQDSKKWLQKQKQSVKELYAIIKDVFAVEGQQAITVRNYALQSGFYSTMLDRLHLITKEPKRQKVEQPKVEEEELVVATLEKKESEEQFKNKLIKKKGVGYGNDSSTNQKWDVTGQEEARKEQSEQILGLLNILQRFLDYKDFTFPDDILEQTFTSSLLPIIESSLRGGSLLQISKYAELFEGQLSFIQVLAKCPKLIPTLMTLPKNYEPKQPESLHSLLRTLENTSKIFLSCLTGSASEKLSEQIAKKIMSTFQIVEEAVSGYAIIHNDEEEQKKILQLPLPKKYPILMKDLRFDYIDMKDSNGKITKHHYASYYQAGHKPPVQKTIRLAQELADVSHALPIDHTNAIFVRCDKERVDYMQALIMGSNGTPYGHGAYLFDIYFEDNYPNGPPKVNLTTTGSGQIRFNPNLYACGKVCLSLLGTWRGNAMENWDAKVSTLLQVLVSIQSIIMSQDIYFNEPGFQHQQGTSEGEKKNQAYANIVRYGNVKFAMLQNIKNPPKGFETIIRRHFYLKKDQILQECQKWLKLADKRQASYNGLVSDHNYNWCNTFKKSKTQYKTMLQKAVKELEQEMNKLPPPTHEDMTQRKSTKKQNKKEKNIQIKKQEIPIQQIDVSYGGVEKQYAELDINDERVKDRWSRYIGAMGVQAVSKQSKASIVLLGLGGLGIQIAKNIVLSGCKQLSIWDKQVVQWSHLSGQFFLGESDIGKSRLQSSIYKLQELNHYVKVSQFQYNIDDLRTMQKFQVVIATNQNHQELLKIDQYCRQHQIHFLSADCYGPYGQIFNDFGSQFQVNDINGEQPTDVLIEDIVIAERGIVKVAKGQRHPFQDGETVRLTRLKGMKSQTNQNQSINDTLHKVTVIDQYSFYIGNTLDYSPYEGDGIVRNIKTSKIMTFKPLIEAVTLQNIDPNLEYYDFEKGGNMKLLHSAFLSLSQFEVKYNRLPVAWSQEDAGKFIQIVKEKKNELNESEIEYLNLFSYTCSGSFGPIFAFFGGLASQQIFKAITGKYTPIHQYFLADFAEIVQAPPKQPELWNQFIEKRKPINDRKQGLRRVIGNDLIRKLQNSNVFMIGSGAIGCELLKNLAMLEVGAGQQLGQGSIVVTDPDHIQTSNLNRQFLFREKHLRKPKSATAAAAIVQMNPRLKGHIRARLDKVCEGTRDIYSNQFFQGLTIVTNALDNVEARRYVDSRCVESKIALLESGTLSSKGHVQVIIPYLTQTYGSKQDPNDANGDIPHCTLKMFPQQTLHCVEWARDIFGKQFTLAPKALSKLLQSKQDYVPGPSDIQMLKDCLKVLESRPSNFDEAVGAAAKLFYQIYRNDIMQLLYTYPLDAKTKDGKPFWKLPKRPPTPIESIDPTNQLHATFIASYAVLLCKIHNIPFPKNFRETKQRQQIAAQATKFKIADFIPSDKVAKQMTEQVNKNDEQKDSEDQPKQEQNEEGEVGLYEKFKAVISQLKQGGETIESKPEQFEKDQDQNGHIDLIYSMANLRSRNYKLDQMDWITVKLKAGRIMPALSTTTSCIAALQTIELVKYIKGCKLEAMRNAFINLAVPILQLGQPGPVQTIKVHDNLTTNLWERWTVGPHSKTVTLGEVIKSTEQKYKITVKGLSLLEGGQLYSDIVLGLQSKRAEKEQLLSRTVKDIVNDELGQQDFGNSLDMTLVMSVGVQLIKHAPTLRLLIQT